MNRCPVTASRFWPPVLVVLALSLSGCGQAKKPLAHPANPSARHVLAPDQTSCSALRTRAASDRLAGKLVDRAVAPYHQSQRQTIGIIGESLWATCRQPTLPGVRDVATYRPVRAVLKAIQRDFDEQAITGG
jgi:predicted small lipoprotein YifL